jgi:phage shock protein C
MRRPGTKNYPSGPYRSRSGVIFGVCRGLAEYFDLSVVGIRLVVVMLAFFTAFWPMLAGYVLAALLMKPAPVVPLRTTDEAEFYNSYTNSRSMALARLKRTFDRLDHRLQRLESIVTDREYQWDRRFRDSDKR